jgi:hypothetical protein
MGKFRLIGIGIAMVVVSACSGGKPTCRTALSHAVDVFQSSAAPDEVKQQAKADLEDGIKQCEAEHPPQEVLDCTMKASSVDDLEACDKLRTK